MAASLGATTNGKNGIGKKNAKENMNANAQLPEQFANRNTKMPHS